MIREHNRKQRERQAKLRKTYGFRLDYAINRNKKLPKPETDADFKEYLYVMKREQKDNNKFLDGGPHADLVRQWESREILEPEPKPQPIEEHQPRIFEATGGEYIPPTKGKPKPDPAPVPTQARSEPKKDKSLAKKVKTYEGPFNQKSGYPKTKTFGEHLGLPGLSHARKREIWDAHGSR